MIGLVVLQNNYYADLVITPANVKLIKGEVLTGLVANGQTITRGEALWLSRAIAIPGPWIYQAVNDSIPESRLCGIALSDAQAGQYVSYVYEGIIDIGATLTVGTIYVLSFLYGKIFPITDLGLGEYLTIVGVATATNRLHLTPFATEVIPVTS